MTTQSLALHATPKGRFMEFIAYLFGDKTALVIAVLSVAPGFVFSQFDSLHLLLSAAGSGVAVVFTQLLRFWLRARAQRDQVEKDNADRWYKAYTESESSKERLIGLIIELSAGVDHDTRRRIFRQLAEARTSEQTN